METKTVTYELNYNEKGKVKKYPVKISFIANDVRDKYSEILKVIAKTKDIFQRLTDILKEKGEIISINKDSKIEDLKEKFVKLDEEYVTLQKELEAIGKSDFFSQRRDIIKTILADNGYEDKLVQEDDFWSRKVYPESMNEFLNAVVYKDFNLEEAVKKKAK